MAQALKVRNTKTQINIYIVRKKAKGVQKVK